MTPRPGHAWRHATIVVGAFSLLFGWLFLYAPVHRAYIAESDLYEFFLPVFLTKFTVWSTFEFGGMPAFADPGEYRFYPLFLLARLAGSWTMFVASGLILAAAGTYAYVYAVTRSRASAALAAIAYGLSEAFVERLAHLALLHTVAWLPLILLSIDRLRGSHRLRWIGLGALSVGSCLLAGNPQTFLYIGYAALLYGVVGGIAERAPIRYWGAALAMGVLGGALGLVKLAPTFEAALYTARQTQSFAQFVNYANTPLQTLSILFPAIDHAGREAPTYVGIATLVLATAALGTLRRNWRVGFWVVIAAGALLLGMGESTPLAAAAFELPLYDRFRVVARHLFLAAFALAVLAGFGADALRRREAGRVTGWLAAATIPLAVITVGMLVIARGAVPVDDTVRFPVATQVVLALASAAACLLLAIRSTSSAAVGGLCGLLILDLIHAVPYAVTPAGLELPVIPASAVTPSVHATALAQRLRPLHQRLLSPAGTQIDAVVPAMFARLWEIPIAGGYGPMLLSRYSTLAMMGTNGSVEPALLASHNAALDVLAVREVVVDARQLAQGDTIERRGITWSAEAIDLAVGPEECGQRVPRHATYSLPPETTVSAVVLAAHLRCAEDTPQDTPVATVRVVGSAGVVLEQQLRAGVHIADERLNDEDVRRRAKHRIADVFDPGADRYSYVSRIDVPASPAGLRLEIDLTDTTGSMQIDRLTVLDGAGRSVPQSATSAMLSDANRWTPSGSFRTSRVSDRGSDEDAPAEQQYLTFENRRALPRAWLASEVIPLDAAAADAALHYSLLPDGRRFDPRSMAIVERGAVPPSQRNSASATVSIDSIDNGFARLHVSSEDGGLVVLSESFYPGWRATLDGVSAPNLVTDGALQGVLVPGGAHVLEFRFVPVSLYAGTGLSLAALAAIAVAIWRGASLPPRRAGGS